MNFIWSVIPVTDEQNEANQRVNSVIVVFWMQHVSVRINLNETIYLRPSV